MSTWRRIGCCLFAAVAAVGASAEELSAQAYVQRGLIANWDGIENAVGMDGLGRHDAAVKIWTDLVSGFRFTLNNVTVGESYLEFNGSNAYGELHNACAALAFPSGEKTVEVVVRFDSLEAHSVALHGTSASGVALGYHTTAGIPAGNIKACNAYAPPTVGDIGCYSTVYQSSDNMPSALSLNGAAIDPYGQASYWSGANTGAYIGRRSGSAASPLWFTGRIYAIRVYNRALTAEEVAANNAIDRARFFGDSSSAPTPPDFRLAAVPAQGYDGTHACTPVPRIVDRETGAELDADDFDFSYSGNAAVGRATVTATGKSGTDFEGQEASASFAVVPVYRVSASGASGNAGDSWEAAMTFDAAMTAASAAGGELWLANDADIITSGNQDKKFTLGGPVFLRGGFAGAESSAAERSPSAKRSVLNALSEEGTRATYTLQFLNYLPLTVENVEFINGQKACLVKPASPGDVTLTNCVIALAKKGGYNSHTFGVSFNGSGAALLRMDGCTVRDNGGFSERMQNAFSGVGAQFTDLARAWISNCTFATNGVKYSSWVGLDGAAFTAVNTPVTVIRSKFVGNVASLGSSASGATDIIYLNGATGVSAFTNCVFAGNSMDPRSQADSNGGVICANLGAGGTLDVVNCTFAGNASTGTKKTGGIHAVAGEVAVRNSIFWENTVPATCEKPSDLYVGDGASASADYCLFSSKGTGAYGKSAAGTISVTEVHCLFDDPLFADAAAFDVHLLSAEGYRTDADGAWHVADVQSPAIDAGDPEMSCANEPGRNGGVVNLGAYGNTEDASQTPVTEPKVAGAVTISFDGDYSQPTVRFTAGGTGAYSAQAVIRFSSDDGSTWGSASDPITGITNGAPVVFVSSEMFEQGLTIIARVELRANAKAEPDVADSAATVVTKPLPPWYGKKGPPNVIHVRMGATGKGDGTSWTDAMPDLDAALRSLDAEKNEIWFAGTQSCVKSSEYTFGGAFAIRGGFTGCETNAAERLRGARSVIDGQETYNPFTFSNTEPLTLDGLEFTRGDLYNLIKTASAGDLTITNCAITEAVYGASGRYEGVTCGASLTGSESAYLTVVDSVVHHNGRCSDSNWEKAPSRGLYCTGFSGATIERCAFSDNGRSARTGRSCQSRGVALYLSGMSARVSRCAFVGNRAATANAHATVLYFDGEAAGSEVENCVFAGNLIEGGASTTGGALCFNLANATDTAAVRNCTFADNISNATATPTGLLVLKGDVDVRNCIFWGNARSASCSVGADLHVADTGSAAVNYCLFPENGIASFTKSSGASWTFNDTTCAFQDPLFVSNVTAKASLPYADASGIDVHLLSVEGYRVNGDDEWHQAESAFSPAIDTGDKLSDCSNEPTPNGGRINMGAYGNTDEASKTPFAKPEIDGDVSVDFDGEYSQPTVRLRLGGTGAYSASVDIEIATNGVPAFAARLPASYGNGSTVEYLVPQYFLPGCTLVATARVAAGEESDEAESAGTVVSKPLPPWYGKGGGANVVHVRPGATGKGDGSSWSDAVTDFHKGVLMLTETRNELWLAGSNVLAEAQGEYAFGTAAVLRGGFTGIESSPAERKAGARSVLDGDRKYNPLSFRNDAAVTVESIEFRDAVSRGIMKTGGGGDLTVTNCVIFRARHNPAQAWAKGGTFTGTADATLRLLDTAVVECGYSVGGLCLADSGLGVGCNTFKEVVIDGCRFENCARTGTYTGFSGSALYISNARATVRRTAFVGNGAMAGNGTGGDLIRIEGKSDGSRFVNCAFVGNTVNSSGAPSCVLGVNMSQGNACSIENCTFAYNVGYNQSGTFKSARTLEVMGGEVSVSNSVFWGNVRHVKCPSAVEIRVRDGASAAVGYCLFGGRGEEYYEAEEGGALDLDETTCVFGDPLFVTSTEEFKTLAHVNALPTVSDTQANLSYANALLLDVHLTKHSPAIDTGDPKVKCVEPHPNGHRVNMGAYGNTPWATLSKQGLLLFVR